MDFKVKLIEKSIMKKIILFITLLLPIYSVAQELTLKAVEKKPPDITWGEQISYNWKDSQGSQIVVVFRQRILDGNWISKLEFSNDGNNTIYTSSQLSFILDESWNYFENEKPYAYLVNISFNVSECSNIWDELQNGLRSMLPQLDCCTSFKSKKLVELFSSIFSSSKGLEDFANVISSHGKAIAYAGPWDMIMIEESLLGKEWGELVNAPNFGLKKPVLVGISLNAK